MREITVKLYQYDELSEKAQEKAREWWVTVDNQYFDASDITDIYIAALEELGYPTDKIGWSLGFCQGDGMAFYGEVDLNKWLEVTKNKTRFKALQNSKGLTVTASLSKNSHGSHYSHWNTMDTTVEWEPYCSNQVETRDPTPRQVQAMRELEAALTEHVQETSRKLERMGYDEIEYMHSDEIVADSIRINEYEFTEGGGIV